MESEKIEYAKSLNSILDKNEIKKENIFIGGFSSGGNVSVLLTNYLLKTKNSIQPKGIFAVDSPLDLKELYNGAKRDIKRNLDKDAIEEGKFLVEMLEQEIGKPEVSIEKYKTLSPYIVLSNSTTNIEHLKNIKVRFYCEPDLEWQMKNKGRKYEELNAYKLEKTYISLVNLGSKNAEFIKTKNRGIRANGEKNTHSWNIVERESLLKWINE
jgi:CRISPR/Cas system endoribonuclease Cas6 (RAMP superfamily)